MTKYFYFLFAFAIISITACQSEQSTDDLATEIKALEDSVFTENMEGYKPLQDENARLLVEKYEAYVKTDIEEVKALIALSRAIGIAEYNKSYAKAAQLIQQIYTDYPESNAAADARLREAILYDTKIQNVDKAKELYEAFIKDYPNHKDVDLAKQALSALGKSLEDILKEAKEKAGEVVK
ncbi:MAG: tol-pal system YbgF family protein [Saprospiraceae bacterium]